MGTSLVGWTQELLGARPVRLRRARLRPDQRGQHGRLEGLRGGRRGQGRARVGVARASRSSSRPTACAPTSIQAGVTDTPALRAIPGSDHLKAQARAAQSVPPLDDAAGRRQRHLPARRLDEAAWINGEIDPRRRRRAHLGGGIVTLYLHGLGHFHPENEITNALSRGARHRHQRRVDPRARRHPLAAHGAAARLHPHDAQPRRPRRRRGDALHERRAPARRAAEMAIARAGIDKSDDRHADRRPLGDGHRDAGRGLQRRARARARGAGASTSTPPARASSCRLHLLSLMDPAKLPDFVLLVVPESADARPSTTTTARSAVLWGDGSGRGGASRRASRAAPSVLGSTAGSRARPAPTRSWCRASDTSARRAARCRCSRSARPSSCSSACARRTATTSARFHFVGHQANLRMLDAVCARVRASPDERHHTNVEWYGNTAGAAARPRCCRCTGTSGARDDDVAVVGVGAGLTWSSYLAALRRRSA